MKTKTIYITTDNERFDDEIQAEKHQQDIIGAQMDSLLAFLGVRDTLTPPSTNTCVLFWTPQEKPIDQPIEPAD